MLAIRIEFLDQFLFCLDSPVAANVFDPYSTIEQHSRHQQAPVAPARILLGAKQGNIVLADSPLEARKCVLKNARRRDAIVQNMSVSIVEHVFRRPAAEFTAEIEVLQSRCLYGEFQCFSGKMAGDLE